MDKWLNFTNYNDFDFSVLDLQCPYWPIFHQYNQGKWKAKIIIFNTFRNSKIFLDNQSSPDSSTHACFYPEIDISNNLSNHIYIYDSLDDSLSQTLGEFSLFHDQKLLSRECHLFMWFPDYICFYNNDSRLRFFIGSYKALERFIQKFRSIVHFWFYSFAIFYSLNPSAVAPKMLQVD